MGWKIWGPRQREGAIAATFRRLRLHVPICKENRQSGNAPPAGFSNILAHVFSGRFHLTSAIAPLFAAPSNVPHIRNFMRLRAARALSACSGREIIYIWNTCTKS